MEVDDPQVYLLGKTYLTNNERFYIRNDLIVHMAAGDRHSIIVTESGRAYAFGDNNSGQLGLGHINAVDKVSCIKSLKFGETEEKIILAACGRESSLVATNRGSLYAFGLNHCCQLGVQSEGTITTHPSPMKIEYFSSKISWKQLAMGAEHTCVLTNDGQVYVWGSNEVSQCGLERRYKIIRTPKELSLEYSVNAISCGYYHTALISKEGRLFLFGNNSDGQLGRSTPDQNINPLEISLPDPVQAVACGHQHTVVLTEKGNVYTCGRGDRGQLGLGRKISSVKRFQMIEKLSKHLTAIAAGAVHTAIIDSSGGIYLFGDGKYGKLNYDTHSDQFKPYFLDQLKGYNVLKVVCGGCQTIIFAQKKSVQNTTDSETESIDNLNEISNNGSSSVQTESISNPDELLTSMKRTLMNTVRLAINGKLRLTNSWPEKQKVAPEVLDRTVSFHRTTDDLVISNNRFLSIEKSSVHNRKLNYRSNLKMQTKFDDERSLSAERSFAVSEQINERNLSMKTNDESNCHTPSSTNSGCTSSSISSLQDENLPMIPDSAVAIEDSCHSSASKTLRKPHVITSTDQSIKTKSKSGLFARIRKEKSSQKSAIATNQNSKACLIM